MAKHTKVVSNSSTSVLVGKAFSTREYEGFGATIFVGVDSENFDNGTVKIQISPDGGTTKIDAKDPTGTALSFTANGYGTIVLGNGNTNDDFIEVYATISSQGASASVTVSMFDTR